MKKKKQQSVPQQPPPTQTPLEPPSEEGSSHGHQQPTSQLRGSPHSQMIAHQQTQLMQQHHQQPMGMLMPPIRHGMPQSHQMTIGSPMPPHMGQQPPYPQDNLHALQRVLNNMEEKGMQDDPRYSQLKSMAYRSKTAPGPTNTGVPNASHMTQGPTGGMNPPQGMPISPNGSMVGQQSMPPPHIHATIHEQMHPMPPPLSLQSTGPGMSMGSHLPHGQPLPEMPPPQLPQGNFPNPNVYSGHQLDVNHGQNIMGPMPDLTSKSNTLNVQQIQQFKAQVSVYRLLIRNHQISEANLLAAQGKRPLPPFPGVGAPDFQRHSQPPQQASPQPLPALPLQQQNIPGMQPPMRHPSRIPMGGVQSPIQTPVMGHSSSSPNVVVTQIPHNIPSGQMPTSIMGLTNQPLRMPTQAPPLQPAIQMPNMKQNRVTSLPKPEGVDPLDILMEREQRLRDTIKKRISMLENLPSNLLPEVNLKASIELRALRLLNFQRQVINQSKGSIFVYFYFK
ncbi:hypothetical protein CHUAL_004770 [Chamberlinius hualienensis]